MELDESILWKMRFVGMKSRGVYETPGEQFYIQQEEQLKV